MRTLTLFIIGIIAFFGCNSDDTADNNRPSCLTDIIDSILEIEVKESSAKITLYQYQDQTVYLVQQPFVCPDCFSDEVIDELCQTICYAGGSIAGNGDQRCPEFFDEATDEVIIWEDPR